MNSITPQNLMERNRSTRPYELTVIKSGPNEYRHYWNYAEALADFNAGKDAGECIVLQALKRLKDGGNKTLGLYRTDFRPDQQVVYDENDGPDWLFDHFAWETIGEPVDISPNAGEWDTPDE